MTNQMNLLFATLADPTRRAVIERLVAGEAPIKELAQPHDMALPTFLRHVERLEEAGLVTTRKEGRQRIVSMTPDAFAPVEGWLATQKRIWERRLDRLDALARQIEAEANPFPGPHVPRKPVDG